MSATLDRFNLVTTTYGKTLALEAKSGGVLWEYTPPSYPALASMRQITNSTPVADPDWQFIYAASPNRYRKASRQRACLGTSITRLPPREKMASPLKVFQDHVIAATAGYIGDRPPYQGHVAILDVNSGKLLQVMQQPHRAA